MNLGDYLQFVVALALVLALIAVLAWLAKRAGYGGGLAQTIKLPAERRRLAVLEVLPLDPRRKLVLLRAGEREHLLLLNHGQGPDLVVDSRSTGNQSSGGQSTGGQSTGGQSTGGQSTGSESGDAGT